MSENSSSGPANQSGYIELIVDIRSSRQQYRVRSDARLKRLFDVCLERHPYLKSIKRLNFIFENTVLKPDDTPSALGLFKGAVISAVENGDSG